MENNKLNQENIKKVSQQIQVMYLEEHYNLMKQKSSEQENIILQLQEQVQQIQQQQTISDQNYDNVIIENQKLTQENMKLVDTNKFYMQTIEQLQNARNAEGLQFEELKVYSDELEHQYNALFQNFHLIKDELQQRQIYFENQLATQAFNVKTKTLQCIKNTCLQAQLIEGVEQQLSGSKQNLTLSIADAEEQVSLQNNSKAQPEIDSKSNDLAEENKRLKMELNDLQQQKLKIKNCIKYLFTESQALQELTVDDLLIKMQ